MTAAGKRILIIGGGFAGMAAAIEFRKRDAQVDLVEIDAGWRSYGAGISLGGPALRAFKTLGILEAFLERGSATDGAHLYTASGHVLAKLPAPRIAGPDIPGGGAIMRPVLAAILAEATRKSGADVRLGETFTRITQHADGAAVTFTSGDTRRYDLVAGADGLNSRTRAAIFPEAPKPAYSGQSVWRAVLPRPAEVDCAMLWLGDKVKAGVNPVSANEMYLFVTENRPVNTYIDPSRFPDMLAALLAQFSAPILHDIQVSLSSNSTIVYRPLEILLMPRPWSKGRVVLIGDAVHATTPHLASGACIGIEDAIVLAEEIGHAATIPDGLAAFEERRWERCRMVVQNSKRLGEIEIESGDSREHARLMQESMMALAARI